MATTQFSTTIQDDDMEISSDIDHRPGMDEDIDIDLDLTDGRTEDQDDDYNIRDASLEPAGIETDSTAAMNDDIMLDEENVMQDDGHVQDEEIFDVNDTTEHVEIKDFAIPDQLDATRNDQFGTSVEEMGTSSAPVSNALNVDTEPDPGILNSISQENPPESTLLTPNENGSEHNQVVSGSVKDSLPLAAEERRSIDRVEEVDDTQRETDDQKDSGESEETRDLQVNSLNSQHPISPQAREQVESHSGQPDAESLIQYHPVVLVYQGSEMSLFPPTVEDAADTFLLEDHELVHQSFQELLKACRSVLADSISEEDELEINIDDLGLSLNEDSIHTKRTSLFRILEVYIQLLQHDGVEHPDPLYMTLSTRVRFSKRLDDLVHAVSEGKGLSQLPFWTQLSGDEDYEGDENDEPETEHEAEVRTHVVSDEAASETGAAKVQDLRKPPSTQPSTLAIDLQSAEVEAPILQETSKPATSGGEQEGQEEQADGVEENGEEKVGAREVNSTAHAEASEHPHSADDEGPAKDDSQEQYETGDELTGHDKTAVQDNPTNELQGHAHSEHQGLDLPAEDQNASGASTLSADKEERLNDSNINAEGAESHTSYAQTIQQPYSLSEADAVHFISEDAAKLSKEPESDEHVQKQDIESRPGQGSSLANGQDHDDLGHANNLPQGTPQTTPLEIPDDQANDLEEGYSASPRQEDREPEKEQPEYTGDAQAQNDEEAEESWDINVSYPEEIILPAGFDKAEDKPGLGTPLSEDNEETEGDQQIFEPVEGDDESGPAVGEVSDTAAPVLVHEHEDEVGDDEDEINYDDIENGISDDVDEPRADEVDSAYAEVETVTMKRGRPDDEDGEVNEDESQGESKRFRSASRE
ncbi:hypothetical protein L228DRAFT_39817 [Xylona heveae TC161]|uniref:Uncharacterized protein n=1 Tax=Xylona heveae (strain CBS 132557 / TC161) TaxID=1328760 RepID=A0A164ZZ92_XYLHT|nr:hypothetical protein L228DRAFT_39817 [Xylona heveae TC161]KZF19735.1 hypothetical protein L228DRAFT_39817 [Xylona heveae TC161]